MRVQPRAKQSRAKQSRAKQSRAKESENGRAADGGGISAADAYRTFWPFAKPRWRSLVGACLLVVAGSGVSLLTPWPLKYLFDEVLLGQRRDASVQNLLLLIALAIAGIALLDAAIGYLRQLVLTATGQQVAFSLRTALYRKIQNLSLTFHDRQHTGDLITRVTRDVDRVQELVTDNVIEAGASAVTLTGMFTVMMLLDWQLTLAMLLLLPPLFLANVRFRRRIKANEVHVRHKEGDIASLTQETLSSMRVVKVFGRESFESGRFEVQSRQALNATLRVVRTEATFSAAMNVLTAVAMAVLVWLGAHRVFAGSLTPGDLLIFVSYLREFYSPMRALSKLSAQVGKASVRAAKIAEVLDEQPAVQDRPGATPAPPLRGNIRFESVSFGYLPGHDVLHDVSFSVAPGQVLALVGATGAGKSTIAGLVARLYDPTSGRVCVDGRDVRDYTLATLQAQVSFVLQTSLLFSTSVRENIAYGRPDASLADILTAARTANAHDFITALPDDYDTVLGERGDTLSGGERQRIAIARAVVRDTPILVLDEPTTGLDAAAEHEVLDALDRLMAGRTTIVVAHKLASIRHADLILVVDSGRIVESGAHEELLAQDGYYARLCRLQGLAWAPRARAGGA